MKPTQVRHGTCVASIPEIKHVKSLVVAALLIVFANLWLWTKVRGRPVLRAALIVADVGLVALAIWVGGDAVLAALGLAFAVFVVPVIVRERGGAWPDARA